MSLVSCLEQDDSDCGTCQGDADGNGKVEFWDLDQVLANWGCEG